MEQAEDSPELAVLSAMAHGGEPGPEDVLRAFVTGLRRLDERHQELYADIVASALPAAARRSLEALMNLATWEPQSDWLRGYVSRVEARAEAKGEADALLTVLAARGVDIPDELRARIAECTDVDQLRTWLQRAVSATSMQELFA